MNRSDKLDKIRKLLWPDRCLMCGCAVKEGWLCDECLDMKEPGIINLSIELSGRTEHSKVIALAPFDGGWKRSIDAFKFSSAYKMAEGFGMLGELALRELADIETYDIISYVPMTDSKVRARGYNQAELIAEDISRRTGIKAEPLLKKIKENRTQHRLSATERQKNVIGVYGADAGEKIKGGRIILVDDIITTGATLRECCSVLYDAGAAEVLCFCAAYSEGKEP